MTTIDHMNAVDDPAADLITQIEGACALAQRSGQGISPASLMVMVNAAKASVKLHAQAPAPQAPVDPAMFAGGTTIDAISANSATNDAQKRGLRALCSRHGIAVPPAGKGLSHGYLNQMLASQSANDRMRVKQALVEAGLVSLHAA